MQKLWRRPPVPVLFQATTPWAKHKSSSSLSIPMPAFRLPPPTVQLPSLPRRPQFLHSHSCRCSLEARPSRAWALFKESCPGSSRLRSAWLHGRADGDSFVVEGLKNADSRASEDPDAPKQEVSSGQKLSRRQRSPSVAVTAPLPGNPDLLTIPGVGIKNLRKLVDKGIEEVAQLKKLYKDKASIF